jgi:L-seryl-tRNA(Ser) seleniumtransferase
MHEGRLAGPPHHGIGRGFKVGKEEIVGLITALRLYADRDAGAELRQWRADTESIVAALQNICGVAAHVRFPQPGGREIPHAVIAIDPTKADIDANALVNALEECDPPIYVFEHGADAGVLVCMPEALNTGEAAMIGRRLREILTRHTS